MASLRLAMKVDANNPVVGDIYLDAAGKCRMTASLSEEVQQLLYTRLLFFKGEWVLGPDEGTPWFQDILGIKNTAANVSAILKRVITTTPGVLRLLSFSLNPSGRNAAPRFSVQLTDGSILTAADFSALVI